MAPLSLKAEIGIVEHKILAFLDFKHVVLIVALVVALLGGVYLFEDRQVKLAEGRQAVAEAVAKQKDEDAKASATANAQLQAQKDQVIAQLQAANDTLQAANKSLNQQLAQEVVTLLNQQNKVKQAPPTEQAKEWTRLVPSAVVTPTDSGFTVNQQGGVDTIVALEEIQADRNQIVELKGVVANDDKIIANDANVLQAEKDKHQGDLDNDHKQLDAAVADKNRVQAEFDTYKHKSRKRVIKAFFVGYVAGLVTHKFLGL